jgi:hypothetical protein
MDGDGLQILKKKINILGQTKRDMDDSLQFAIQMKISKINVFVKISMCDITKRENVNFR